MSYSFTADTRERARGEPVSKQFDWSVTAPSTAVVQVIAAATGTEPTEGTPLYDSVDSGALDTLFGDADGDPDRRFSFTHEGLTVTLTGDGTVSARPIAESASR
ncbi:hypothetical protein NDI85_12985 [Halomicroarcula sp. S1AR25-4]|uniref:HalOD1 output domain-containing protein n=1 Tax=Haloarcula sp. S1AR25-4 TaxID=2950538 RepID=UPI0028750A1A|nr:HalOD1 output domain-containing protein [Halomicroarcula sp. S1AR25-4]MDS0278714.1 hypothetical protein [Halomicroarcula sp. S1AR25-4]